MVAVAALPAVLIMATAVYGFQSMSVMLHVPSSPLRRHRRPYMGRATPFNLKRQSSHLCEDRCSTVLRSVPTAAEYSIHSEPTDGALESRSFEAHLPLRVPWSRQVQRDVESVLHDFVSASPTVYTSASVTTKDDDSCWKWECIIPAFGGDCLLQLELLPIQVPTLHPDNGDDTNGPVRRDDIGMAGAAAALGTEQLTLSLRGTGLQDADWSWICSQFYRGTDKMASSAISPMSPLDHWVSLHALRQSLVEHYSRQPADPGLDARTAVWSTEDEAAFELALFGLDAGSNSNNRTSAAASFWSTLQTNGYVVIDPLELEALSSPPLRPANNVHVGDDTCNFSLTTTVAQQTALSAYLHETTGQGPLVRTDRVHFLTRDQAAACDIESHYDFCMGIAHVWNTLFESHPRSTTPQLGSDNEELVSCWDPMFPATVQAPYTIPRNLQLAEYGPGDFYTAHSDNSITSERTKWNDPIRSNFRAYTCIVYMSDNGWDLERDGGALRLYPQSQHFVTPADAVRAAASTTPFGQAQHPTFVDVSPINGRLLIFDSCVVHSVQPNTSPHGRRRRALTLWINRPNHSGVRGEQYY